MKQGSMDVHLRCGQRIGTVCLRCHTAEKIGHLKDRLTSGANGGPDLVWPLLPTEPLHRTWFRSPRKGSVLPMFSIIAGFIVLIYVYAKLHSSLSVL